MIDKSRRFFLIKAAKIGLLSGGVFGGLFALIRLGISREETVYILSKLGVKEEEAWAVIRGSGGFSCSEGSAIYDVTGESAGQGITSDAVGQGFTNGSDWYLYSFTFTFGGASTGGDFLIRWGPSYDLTDGTGSYYEELGGTYASGGGTVEVLAETWPLLSASTYYYVGMVKDTGTTCIWRYYTVGGGGHARAANSGWLMQSTVITVRDYTLTIKECAT